MDISLINAALPAIVGATFGGVGATYLFRKFIGNKYGERKAYSKHAKIYYWCGLLATISIAMGFTTIAGEIAYGIFNSATIRGAELAKGTLQLTIFPIIFLIISFVLSKLVREKLIESVNDSTIERKATNKSKYRYFIGVTVVAIIFYQLGTNRGNKKDDGNFEKNWTSDAVIPSTIPTETIPSLPKLTSTVGNQQIAIAGNTKVAFYENSIEKNCKSPYKTKPLAIEEYIVDVANKKVISKYEIVDGEKGIREKSDCIVIDKRNWTCGGGNHSGTPGATFAKTSVVDGKFNYDPGFHPNFPSCPPKIEILN